MVFTCLLVFLGYLLFSVLWCALVLKYFKRPGGLALALVPMYPLVQLLRVLHVEFGPLAGECAEDLRSFQKSWRLS